MSLLLDALKKAADEKNKAAGRAEASAEKHDASSNDDNLKKNSFNKNKLSYSQDDFDLSLDDEALQDVEHQDESISAYQEKHQTDEQKAASSDNHEDYDRLSKVVSPGTSKNVADAQDDDKSTSGIQAEQVIRAPDRAGGNLDYDVSDEALELLIHKTNRSYRKNKIIWVVLVSVLSLALLIAGGLYFTEDMQSKIAFLETRHKQSMHLVRKKTGNESLPDKRVIIENLVGDEGLAKKVEFTKAELEKEKKQLALHAQQEKVKQKQDAEKINSNFSQAYARKPVLSIEKSQQADPVSLWLDEAWLAYEAGELEQADNAYEKVLHTEENNRDALLGRGAIALQNKLFSQAKVFYLALLEINPRDPDAISALTSLAQMNNAASDQVGAVQVGKGLIEKKQFAESEKYLKNLLQENEQSAVLNFSLGNVYAGQNRWKLAQQYFFKAWVNENNNHGYAYNLAVSLDQIGKANEAKKFYQECLRLSNNKKVQFSKQSVLDRIAQIN